MCLYPKLIPNPKYKPNEKNNGKPPVCTDERVKLVPIGCGKCIECRNQKKRQWQVRLMEEVEKDKSGQFVTLSFSDESLIKLERIALEENPKLEGYDLENECATIAIRRFTENWRTRFGKQPKRWLVTELGQTRTERIHIHGLIWTTNKEAIAEMWTWGNTYTGEYVNGKTVNYIVKYIHKTDIMHPNYNPKVLTSKGIGAEFVKKHHTKRHLFKGEETRDYYETRQGYKMNMPMYYRTKLYTDEEREKLWIMKLDKQLRYVCGIKVDVSKGYDDYYQLLEQMRRYNKQLGYGDDSKNWSKIQYEKERRQLKRIERYKSTKSTMENERQKWEKQADELRKTLARLERKIINMDNGEPRRSEGDSGNINNTITDDILQRLGKDFEDRKNDRIQEIEGQLVNTYTGEILEAYPKAKNESQIFKGKGIDEEPLQRQIWS